MFLLFLALQNIQLIKDKSNSFWEETLDCISYQKTVIKFLRFALDNQLTWEAHLDEIYRKITCISDPLLGTNQ